MYVLIQKIWDKCIVYHKSIIYEMNETKIKIKFALLRIYEMEIPLILLTQRYKSSLLGQSAMFFQWFFSFDTRTKISQHHHIPSPFMTLLYHLEILVKLLTLFITIITKIIFLIWETSKIPAFRFFLVRPENDELKYWKQFPSLPSATTNRFMMPSWI